MSIWNELEDEAFNELVNYELNDVVNVLNEFQNYVIPSMQEVFLKEAMDVQSSHFVDKNKIIDYENNQYEKMLAEHKMIKFEDEPAYMFDKLNAATRDKLIQIIEKYFDIRTYKINEYKIDKKSAVKEEFIEKPYDLSLTMLVESRRLYSFLSILGYYQRKKHYFLSVSDWMKINVKYSNEVYKLNKHLGMEWKYWNIFASYGRIDYVAEDGTTNYKKYNFIDLDKISLFELVSPYLKNNTGELENIFKLMMKLFREAWKYDNVWSEIQKQVAGYIYECECKGLMKVL